MTSDYILIGLPVVLFIITLAIIFILRSTDNTKRSVQTVKAMIDGYKKELDREKMNRTQEITDATMRFSNIDSEMNSKIQIITGQLQNLKAYNDDFTKLGAAMAKYEEALTGLARLTRSADDKLTKLEEEINQLDCVKQMIGEFKDEMEGMENQLKSHIQTVKDIEKESVEHINTSVDKVSQACSDDVGKLLSRMEEAFHSTSEQSRALISEMNQKTEAARKAFDNLSASGSDILNSIVDRSADQMLLAARIEELSAERDAILSDLSSLKTQYPSQPEEAPSPSVSEEKEEVSAKAEEAEEEVKEEKKESAPNFEFQDLEISREEEIIFD
ncbi:MAG: hypothetical protein K5634_03695 [Sphaerochaetaceae bacterium]|nr:hypothetical protein [Sphaerochaetaceae bacterium]